MAKDPINDRFNKLHNRIKVLEQRNAILRHGIEQHAMGIQPEWTEFEQQHEQIAGDGTVTSHQEDNGGMFMVNSRYAVMVYEPKEVAVPWEPEKVGRLWHLSIRRVDGSAIHDWRDLQRIKNELVGPETEGVELYPAESRLVDGANQYHLWVIENVQWPIGFSDKLIESSSKDGVQQRPHE